MNEAPSHYPIPSGSTSDYQADFLSSLDTHAAVLDMHGNIVAVNDAWTRFGCDNGALLSSISVGVNYLDVCRRSATDSPDAASVLDGLLTVLTGASPVFRREYRCDAPNIDRWFLVTATPLRSSESGVLVSHSDISQYKLALEIQRQMIDSVRGIVWTADLQTFRTTFVSGQIEEILGFPLDAWLRDPDLWKNHIHPDDHDWALNFTRKAVEEGRNHEFDYRMLAADGHTVWLHQLVNIVRRPGQPSYLVGISVDVTEIHRTQEELQILNGRLINAQEEERKRVARELHDDISQQLAFISVQLSQAAHAPMSPELSSSLANVRQQLQRVTSSVGDLSHSLHPSKLQYLGIAAALRALCRDVSGAHNIQIEYRGQDNSPHLSDEAKLCLYRIAQEALRNVVKHSKAARAFVQLTSSAEGTCLKVGDEGVGFDVRRHTEGLGLVSMGERLKLIGGSIEINSQPNRGTSIEVHVPPEE